MLLFCPHCDDEIEILGEPAPRPMPECERCGAVLEVWETDEELVEVTPAGVAALVETREPMEPEENWAGIKRGTAVGY